MAYFKITNEDFSEYVVNLKVAKQHNFKSMTTAAGNTIVKPINSKYVIEVGFIPLTVEEMKKLQSFIKNITLSISFLDPATGEIKTINTMLSSTIVEYYTIQSGGMTLYKPFTLQFTEL